GLDRAEHIAARGVRDDELQAEQAGQTERGRPKEAQTEDESHAEETLSGREREFLDLPSVQGQTGPASAEQVSDRQGAHQQAPLVRLRQDEGADGGTAQPAQGEHGGDDERGGLRGGRRQPLDEEVAVDAQSRTGGHERLGEGFGAGEDDSRRDGEQDHHSEPSGGSQQIGDEGGGTEELRIVAHLAASGPPQIRDEERDEAEAQPQGDATEDGDGEGDDAQEDEEADVETAAWVQAQGLDGS